MPTITSLIITRKTEQIWCFNDSTMDPSGQPRLANAYSAIGDSANNVTFLTKTGAILYQNIPATVISYIDELDPDNNFPASSGNTALAVIVHLEDNDFFGTSNSGGGSSIAFLNLTDLTPQTYFGNEGKFIRAKLDGTGIEFIEAGASLNQNNTGRVFITDASASTNVTASWLANGLNARTLPFVITETQATILFQVNKAVTGGVEQYVFSFLKGKGTWGGATNPGGALSGNDFFAHPVVPVPATDIIDDPSTQTIEFDLVPEQTISEWLNEQNPSITIQGQEEGYVIFKSGTTTYLWLGDGGVYGEDDLQSTDANFQLIDADAPAPGIPNLNQVLTSGNNSNKNISLEGEAALIVRNGDDNAFIRWIDTFDITSTTDFFLFNNKNVARSVNGILADSDGNIVVPASAIPTFQQVLNSSPSSSSIPLQFTGDSLDFDLFTNKAVVFRGANWVTRISENTGTSNVFEIAPTNGNPSTRIVSGASAWIDLSRGSYIWRLIPSPLTANRVHVFPNDDGDVALIQSSISPSTTKAPSGAAVGDALALKYDKTGGQLAGNITFDNTTREIGASSVPVRRTYSDMVYVYTIQSIGGGIAFRNGAGGRVATIFASGRVLFQPATEVVTDDPNYWHKVMGAGYYDGRLTINTAPVNSNEAVRLSELSSAVATLNNTISSNYIPIAGSTTVTGTKTFSVSPVIPEPTLAAHPVTKNYYDRRHAVVNNTTIGLSAATLNATYPAANYDIGFRVICPNIALGGATYTKYSATGWVMASTVPVM